ncbi:MAG TPA: patatin-like phospholipase family protein [Alphaproteobacteria bacterium]
MALQGGGALGAFTWGVLDRLLEVPGFSPDAISGASAGAANAVVMASGWMTGGRDGAKESLDHFWHRVGMLPSLWRRLPTAFGFDATFAFEMASAIVSPYDFNPLNHNPLRPIIDELTDFERLRSAAAPPLFISATDVETGQARIFTNAELRLEAVLASACLPHLFQAVEIDGRTYWDGGYTANPPIDPLRRFLHRARLLLVLVNPRQRAGIPRTAREIAGRLSQVLGNASVWRDLDRLSGYDAIELPEQQGSAVNTDKYNNDWRFIQSLRDQGRAAAEAWLAARPAIPATASA